MLVFASTSPLVKSVGYDSSIYLSMGRALLNGKILYKEIFDQKGLYLYIINAISILISGKSTVGIFIIEFFFAITNVLFIIKILRELYRDDEVFSVKISALLTILVLFYNYFFEGGNFTEEYTRTFFFISLYLFIKHKSDFKPSVMFVHGLLAAIVMNLRPNGCLLWLPIAVLALIRMLKQKNYRGIFLNMVAGISGLIIGCLPVIIYGLVNDAFYDVLFGTFIYNYKYYIDANGKTIIDKLRGTFGEVMFQPFFIPVLLSILLSCIVVLRNKEHRYDRSLYFFMLLMAIICTSVSGRGYGHYKMYITPFVIPLTCAVSEYASKKNFIKTMYIVILIMAIGLFARNYTNGKSGYCRWTLNERAEYQKFIDINDKYYGLDNSDEKVFSVNFQLSVLLGVAPNIKYFITSGLPDVLSSFAESVISGDNDVIIWDTNYYRIFTDTEYFEQIQSVVQDKYDLAYSDGKPNATLMTRRKNKLNLIVLEGIGID